MAKEKRGYTIRAEFKKGGRNLSRCNGKEKLRYFP